MSLIFSKINKCQKKIRVITRCTFLRSPGDFAVLLRAGMSVKQAMVYNMVSSILCVFGMIVGVCVGNIGSVSLWVFALAGGMFIYIALVDMVSFAVLAL